MTRSQMILALLTLLVTLQACSKTFPRAASPEPIAVAAMETRAQAGRSIPPTRELCRETPAPTPTAASCAQ
jgi:hypothetical protein